MSKDLTVNRNLFSEYYLDNRLPERPEWSENPENVQAQLAALLTNTLPALHTLNEAQTRSDFINPVLDALGWQYDPEISFSAFGKSYSPDYALFLSEEDKHAARTTVPAREGPCGRDYLDRTAALAEAKYWERPLDRRNAGREARRGEDDGARFPESQIIDYLRNSGVRWGILTSGRIWRLYLIESDVFETLCYEADLQAILESGDSDAFKRFYLFFRRESFAPDARGKCFLDHLREGSRQYAARVEESLKERVFDSVVPAIATGFLHHRKQQKDPDPGPEDREELDRIYSATLLLLYRLFFLLYAEARDLLAVGESTGFNARSLTRLKQNIFGALRDGTPLGTTSTDWWDDLRNLFRIINSGDPGLNVPRYNGGLFAPDGLGDPDIGPAAEFLEHNAISDKHLARAIMLLTCHGETGESFTSNKFIDFRDLGVRHLGSVYEGLLEFKLNISDTYLAKATEKGKPVWKPADNPADADLAPGELYLTNDRAERKATGSYYTPDYIVNYIVKNTIGPQIDAMERQYEQALEIHSAAETPDGGSARTMEDIRETLLGDRPAEEAANSRALWKTLSSAGERKNFLLNLLDGVQPPHGYDPITRVLGLNVLDPALGSGHFLVGALDYLMQRLETMLNDYPESPVFDRLREDRRRMLASLEKQGIAADSERFTDLNLLRRMVMKRCLYGVDLNPLAVELSKLSLWLHAFTAGAPLSFLDHHIKCGNSLIGASLDDLGKRVDSAPGLFRLRMEPLARAVGHMLTVAELSDASFEDVERSREEYWKADARVEAYRAMLDSLTAEHFGVEDASHFIDYGMDIDLEHFDRSIEEFPDEDSKRLEQARAEAGERRFFHWNIEFPEVFFERSDGGVREKGGEAGFDAVIGNPPWGGEIGDASNFHEKTRSLSQGQYDIWELFTEISLELISRNGSHGFIVPDSILQPEHIATRKCLIKSSTLSSLIRVGEGAFDVFRAALIYTITEFGIKNDIQTLQLRKEDRNLLDTEQSSIEDLINLRGNSIKRQIFNSTKNHEFRIGLSGPDLELMDKMESDMFSWDTLMDDMRGVELGKKGMVVHCPNCHLWMPLPRGFDQNKAKCKHCNHPIENTANQEQIVGEKKINNNFQRFVVGENVNRYHIDRQFWIDTSYEGINYKSMPFFKSPKILVRKTGVGIYASLDYTDAMSNQVVYIFRKKAEPDEKVGYINLEYVMGLLSSRAMLAYYILRFGEREWRSFPYVTQKILKQLPLKNPNKVPGGRELHDELCKLVRQVTEADGPISKSQDFKIEKLVCRLYGLKDNDQKQIQNVLANTQKLRIIREVCS